MRSWSLAAGDDVVGDQFIIYLDYLGGGLSNRIQGAVEFCRGFISGAVSIS